MLPLLLAGCADRDVNVRQCSVYGLGCAAQHRWVAGAAGSQPGAVVWLCAACRASTPGRHLSPALPSHPLPRPARRSEGFAPHAPAAVAAALALITGPDARSDDNELCFDNAVSGGWVGGVWRCAVATSGMADCLGWAGDRPHGGALRPPAGQLASHRRSAVPPPPHPHPLPAALGKMLEHQPGAVEPGAGSLWVAQLPLKGDGVEARAVHAQLVGFIQRSDPR